MLLFIEGYPYRLDHVVRNGMSVRDVLENVVSLPKLEQSKSLAYVGYCFSEKAQDVIFFLPKVVLTGEKDGNGEDETVFGASPYEIIDFDSAKLKDVFHEADDPQGTKENYKEFLSTLAIWIYRVLCRYKEQHNDNILEPKKNKSEQAGRKHLRNNTLLDIIVAMLDFNRENQNFFAFITRNLHSGMNKINWNRTISHSDPIIQNGSPIYLDPINKKRVVNFDEELLILFFSILNYVREEHGFGYNEPIHYELLNTKVIRKKYIESNYGCRRLKQIKYKYFSDKALKLWELCYAFFDKEHQLSLKNYDQEYLLATDFDHIFEVMVDELISDKKELPDALSSQKDGKLVDHLFVDKGLIEADGHMAEKTYYIGDSKYYKRTKGDNTNVGERSIYKQYTYARNIVQWNLNLFLGQEKQPRTEQPHLRDGLTEGYNPIPNFFISAKIPFRSDNAKFLKFDDKEIRPQGKPEMNRQFENRLFDRDTLLLCHYDVNFLFLVSLYGRNNKRRQEEWKHYVREEFRKKVQDTLKEHFDFFVLQPREGMDCYQYVKDNFHLLNGKIYRPSEDANYLVLALMKGDEETKKLFNIRKEEFLDRERILAGDLERYFDKKEVSLEGDFQYNPIANLGTLEEQEEKPESGEIALVTHVDDNHRKQFLEKGLLYVPAANKDGIINTELITQVPKYVLLHNNGKDAQLFLLKKTSGIQVLTKEQLNALYGFNASSFPYYLISQLRSKKPLDIETFDIERMVNKGAATTKPHLEKIKYPQPIK